MAASLAVSGCSRSDLFVGTWRHSQDDSDYLVIAKAAGRYRLTIFFGSEAQAHLLLNRKGDSLTGVLLRSARKPP